MAEPDHNGKRRSGKGVKAEGQRTRRKRDPGRGAARDGNAGAAVPAEVTDTARTVTPPAAAERPKERSRGLLRTRSRSSSDLLNGARSTRGTSISSR